MTIEQALEHYRYVVRDARVLHGDVARNLRQNQKVRAIDLLMDTTADLIVIKAKELLLQTIINTYNSNIKVVWDDNSQGITVAGITYTMEVP